jgi:hypothetical protein
MKRDLLLLAALCAAAPGIQAQEATVPVPESMVLENVPSIPATLAETVGRYTENRDAFQTDWHPARREMVIGTRFGNTYQAHVVKMPGGARQQLTFPGAGVRRVLSPEGWKLFVVPKRCGRR